NGFDQVAQWRAVLDVVGGYPQPAGGPDGHAAADVTCDGRLDVGGGLGGAAVAQEGAAVALRLGVALGRGLGGDRYVSRARLAGRGGGGRVDEGGRGRGAVADVRGGAGRRVHEGEGLTLPAADEEGAGGEQDVGVGLGGRAGGDVDRAVGHVHGRALADAEAE